MSTLIPFSGRVALFCVSCNSVFPGQFSPSIVGIYNARCGCPGFLTWIDAAYCVRHVVDLLRVLVLLLEVLFYFCQPILFHGGLLTCLYCPGSTPCCFEKKNTRSGNSKPHHRVDITQSCVRSCFTGYFFPGLITMSSEGVVDCRFVCWCCIPCPTFVGESGSWCLGPPPLASSFDCILLRNVTCSWRGLSYSVLTLPPSLSSCSNSLFQLIFALHDDLIFPFFRA